MTADTSVPSTALLSGADRDGSNYTARHLLVLEGLEAVRKRPGMYIGSTDSRGLMHCLWEIIDNSVDEALGGYCDHIEVHPARGRLGRGPRQRPRHPGRRRAEDRPVRRRGRDDQAARRRQVRRRLLRGLRRSARRRRLRGQRAVRPAGRRGRPQRPHPRHQLPPRGARDLHRSGPRRARSTRRAACAGRKKVPKTRTGTRVRYWADRQIFLKDAKLSLEHLHQRARQTAFLVPGLTIVVRDERGRRPGGRQTGRGRSSTSTAASASSASTSHRTRPVCDVLRLRGAGTFKETVPVLDDRGHMTPTEVTRELGVDIALRWGTGYDTTLTLVRQHHRHPQGRHPRDRLRALPHQDRQRGRCAPPSCCASPRTTSSRTTPWRA